MALITTLSDVESRLGREISDLAEVELVETLLEDAERLISRRAPSGTLDPASLDPLAVKQVAASAVARVLRNPDGYRSESAGGVSYTLDTRAAAGFLTILADEWALLGMPGVSAGSFGPTLQVPGAGAYGHPPVLEGRTRWLFSQGGWT